MAKTSEFLKKLLQGLTKAQQQPSKKQWEDEVKQQGRSVSNNLKGNPELAKKHLKTWATKFQGFDWDTLKFSEETDPTKLKQKVTKFAAEVFAEARVLATDLRV